MRKHYIFIGSLIIFVTLLIITSFSLIGSPISQKEKKLDQQRLDHFKRIDNTMQRYVSSNNSLPKNLSQLNSSSYALNINDPETKKTYDYIILSDSSYKLCTTFSLDSKEVLAKSIYQDVDSYKKGYDCIEYSILQRSRLKLSPTPTPPPSGITCTSTYLGVSHQFKVGEQLCKGFSYTGKTCTTSTEVYTCQPNGKWSLTPCSAGTKCAYSLSSTKVSCLASCTEATPTPTSTMP